MKTIELQMVLAAAGFYTGGLDGIMGPKTREAISLAIGIKYIRPDRRDVAAVQTVLNKMGFEAGKVDGLEGHNTREALNAFLFKLANGGAQEVIDRSVRNAAWKSRVEYEAPDRLPSQKELTAFYGDPVKDVPLRLVSIEPPYPMVLDWDLSQEVKTIRVHRSAAPSLTAALTEVGKTFYPRVITELGLHRYAGCYNKRRMRGGSSWSVHAYGAAIDIFAAPNALRMRCPQALFCGEEYKPFLDIMERHGWLPAIRLWGADAMHFQRATL